MSSCLLPSLSLSTREHFRDNVTLLSPPALSSGAPSTYHALFYLECQQRLKILDRGIDISFIRSDTVWGFSLGPFWTSKPINPKRLLLSVILNHSHNCKSQSPSSTSTYTLSSLLKYCCHSPALYLFPNKSLSLWWLPTHSSSFYYAYWSAPLTNQPTNQPTMFSRTLSFL